MVSAQRVVRVADAADGRLDPGFGKALGVLDRNILGAAIAVMDEAAAAGGMKPMGSRSRRLLNQSTHSRVANSTASKLRHGPRRWMTSAL